MLNVCSEEVRPGGAGNVISNLMQFGAEVFGCGVVGDDQEGQKLIAEIKKTGAGDDGIFKDKERFTTVKTRMMGHLQTAGKGVQQLLRVDYENTHPLSKEMEDKICDYLQKHLPNCDIVIISDMSKGVITDRVINVVKKIMKEHSVPAIVDPKLGGDYNSYKGFTAITPNRYETELATGISNSRLKFT